LGHPKENVTDIVGMSSICMKDFEFGMIQRFAVKSIGFFNDPYAVN